MKPRQKQQLEQLKGELEAIQQQVPEDPAVFMREWLGFQPTSYQFDFIEKFQKSQFLAARWCRQSGKSQTIAALLLHYALTHPNINIGIIGPSWRQTKLIIRRINQFLRRIPRGYYYRPQHTIVRLKNGSIIEASPNNPETIRGHTLHVVYADEFNFIANDEEMYDAIIFTMGTTNGKFVCSSTPWSTDSIFWRIFNDPAYQDFVKSHITYEQALEPNGPLKKEILEKIRRQLEGIHGAGAAKCLRNGLKTKAYGSPKP
ncbi:terminase family protein [Candidatus Bathyarchaeota archaeon]|nr:terminase family protein [Candidatus Bathyarchaeota archaeon]